MSLFRVVYFDGPTRGNIAAVGLMSRDATFQRANLALSQIYKPRTTVINSLPIVSQRLAILGPRKNPERREGVIRAGLATDATDTDTR